MAEIKSISPCLGFEVYRKILSTWLCVALILKLHGLIVTKSTNKYLGLGINMYSKV